MFDWADMTKTALTSGRGRMQRRSGCTSSFEPMNTDIYCGVLIIILCVLRICITPVLFYAFKFVNDVLCESVDLV